MFLSHFCTMSGAHLFPWEVICSTIAREILIQLKEMKGFLSIKWTRLNWDGRKWEENQRKWTTNLTISESWRKSSVLSSCKFFPSTKFSFSTSASEGLHTFLCCLLGFWMEANFSSWVMNTGLLESKGGTEKVRKLINYTS